MRDSEFPTTGFPSTFRYSAAGFSLPAKRRKSTRDNAGPPGLFDLPTRDELRGCWELCRLHNNIGFWVVWLPTAWSLMMAYHAQPQMPITAPFLRALLYVPLCFGVKSLIMTIDDILDADVDIKVERTKYRAIPRKAVSLERAWLFFGIQCAIGVWAATYFLSPTALYVSMAVWPIYLVYPTLKRWMDYAPIPLGLMFKVGVFMGWADITLDESIPWDMLVPLYIGATLWNVTYETIYQHQDKVDDIRIGLRSLALKMDTWTIPFCFITGVAFMSLLCYSGIQNGHGLVFFAFILYAAVLLLKSVMETDVDRPDDCKQMFLQTPNIGRIILAGILLDAIHQRLRDGIPL